AAPLPRGAPPLRACARADRGRLRLLRLARTHRLSARRLRRLAARVRPRAPHVADALRAPEAPVRAVRSASPTAGGRRRAARTVALDPDVVRGLASGPLAAGDVLEHAGREQ